MPLLVILAGAFVAWKIFNPSPATPANAPLPIMRGTSPANASNLLGVQRSNVFLQGDAPTQMSDAAQVRFVVPRRIVPR